MRRHLVGPLLAILVVVAGCAQPMPLPTPTPHPEPGGPQGVDAAGWAVAMCQAVDQLEQAVGDPTTGERSAAWQEFESQLTGADEERLKAAANGVLGHLTEGSRSAQTARSFGPGERSASELETLLDGLAMGVRELRDGTLEADVERVNAARSAIESNYENHYEQALGQMTEVPLDGAPLPCA